MFVESAASEREVVEGAVEGYKGDFDDFYHTRK
jgi:hypothetical protein